MHGALRGKGLGRSVCPTGGMCGTSPAEDKLDQRLWAQKIEEETGALERERRPKTLPSFCWTTSSKAKGGKRTIDFVLVFFFFLLMCFANLPFAKGFQITALSPEKSHSAE